MRSLNPVIPVFISSPSDVSAERRLTEAAIHALAPRFANLLGVTLVPLLWEEFAPISSHDACHPQVTILRRIQPFSIFVGILWNRLGTPVGSSGKTGTQLEFEHAIKYRSSISILSYFRDQTSLRRLPRENQRQQEGVRDLKRRLQRLKLITMDYGDLAQFRSRIIPDILEAALQLVMSREPRKIAELYRFFQFGSHWRLGARPLLIVYPPITEPGPAYVRPRLDWRQRLLPHVIYEDFKAIQDIEEAMRLLGREYETVTTDSPILDMAEPGDRVWICIPRNPHARRVLEQLVSQKRQVRFRFAARSLGHGKWENGLAWIRDGRRIQIRSPLRKYLRFSPRPAHAAEWRPSFGHTYCRDYAVLARFKVYRDPVDRTSEFYYHYFIGGIRGLGTWGVGYLLDHETAQLVRLADRQSVLTETGDVQLLLEVTFENFHVTRVRDVSEEPESFFATRDSDTYVRSQLARHRR